MVIWIALGVVLRFTGLGVHSLWFDEGGFVAVAISDDPLATLHADRHPPISFLALRGWIACFGESDVAMRTLPALVSSLALAAFAYWVRKSRAAATAVALFAVAPFQIWYGQELRMYAFVELAALIAWLGVANFLETRRVLGAALVFAGTLAATGSHFLGGLVLPAIIVVAWLRRRELGQRAAFALCATAILGAGAWIPWLATVAGRPFDWGRFGHHDLRAVLETPIRQILTALGAVPPKWSFAVYALGAVYAIGWVALAWRALARRSIADFELIALAAVPIAVAWLLDAIFQIGFLPKYAIVAAPAVVLATAEGLASVQPRFAARTLAAIGIVGAATMTLWLRSANRSEDFRAASASLLTRWSEGDRVVVLTGTPEPFSSGCVKHYVRERSDVLASFVSEADLDALLVGGLQPGARLHIVHRGDDSRPPALRRIEGSMALVERVPRNIRVEYSLWRAPAR